MALLLIGIKPRRHRIRLALLLVVLAIGAQNVMGCSGTNAAGSKSGSGSSSPTDPGTSLGTEVLAITTAGSDGANTVRHDYTYQVTVQ